MRAIVLAAGKGSRMLSTVPKPLHLVNGVPMTRHILKALEELDLESTVVVVGHQAALVCKTLIQMSSEPTRLEFAEQRVQLGTADAAKVGLQAIASGDELGVDSDVLVLPGDMPLLTSKTLIKLQAHHVKLDRKSVV